MFPFLAPIRSATSKCTFNIKSDKVVEVEFFTTIPPYPPLAETPRKRNISGNSEAATSLSVSSGSRPNSRTKSKSPLTISQPSSARSAKSSPVPPAPSEVPPHISRHRNKGLETSNAMLEMFGGGASVFGPGSAFQRIPPPPAEEQRNFGRTNALERESHEKSQWENVRNPQANTGPFFASVEDHDRVYEKAQKRGNWKTSDSQFSQVAQPGPEWFEGFEKMDMTGIELPPDPNCPAAKVLAAATSSNPFEMEEPEISTPESGGDWKEAKEKVLDDSPTLSEDKKLLLCQPGPDLGDDEEEEAAGSTSIASSRRQSSAGAESDSGARVQDAGNETAGSEDAAGGDGTMSLLIRGAQVINDDSVFAADVLIENDVIKSVGVGLEAPAGCQIIEANGRMLLPAGIDVHTHFTAPESADDVATGCKAALAGGTATVVEMVSPKSGESMGSAIQRVRQSLDTALCNVALSVVVRSWSEAVKKEMEKAVGDGVNSFIVDVEGDDKLYQILEFCRTLGAHVRILPENRNIVSFLEKRMLDMGITGPEGFLQSRPEELESERVSSVCVLSQITNCPVSILSISSADSLSSLEKARSSGALSHAEVAAAAVASDGSHYFNKCLKHASGHLTDVPLRTEGANKLVAALATQPLAVCTSGHRAISSASRSAAKDFTGMPKGTAGVEERMSVVWEKAVRTGRIDPMRFVAVTSSNAAKMFNMYPKKGRIAVGADADLVLWDTSVKRKLGASAGQSAADVSIYEGFTVHSEAAITIVGGRVAWKDGGVKDAKGGYLALSPNSPYLFSVVQQRDKMGCAEKVDREPSTNGVGPKKSTGEAPRSAGGRRHFESNIEFGSSDNRPTATRVRNPPGGKTTGFW